MKKASDKVKHYFDCEVVNTEYDYKNHVIYTDEGWKPFGVEE